MELRDYIERAAQKTTTQKALAEFLGLSQQALTEAKSGRRGLPAFASVKLAQLLSEVECRVIAASELVTETNPERRAIWLPFVQELAANAPKRAMAETKATARKVAKTSIALLSRSIETS